MCSCQEAAASLHLLGKPSDLGSKLLGTLSEARVGSEQVAPIRRPRAGPSTSPLLAPRRTLQCQIGFTDGEPVRYSLARSLRYQTKPPRRWLLGPLFNVHVRCLRRQPLNTAVLLHREWERKLGESKKRTCYSYLGTASSPLAMRARSLTPKNRCFLSESSALLQLAHWRTP